MELPAGHRVSPARLEEFASIYKEAYGEEVTAAEVTEMTHCLLALFKLLMRPLPGEKKAPSQEARAQTAPESF